VSFKPIWENGVNVLEIRGVSAGYGRVSVLQQISLSVGEKSVAVLLGANGAGKTTTLRAISGMIKYSGQILLDGKDLKGLAPDQVARLGVAHGLQGRGTFTDLTVEENLSVGAYRRRDKAEIASDIEEMYALFPRLRERRKQKAGSLSGGEQQMLAVGRALMLKPRVMLLDEPSLGLAPVIIDDLYEALQRVNHSLGTAMLIVEQNANLALEIADDAYVLETGSMVLSGAARDVAENDGVRAAYLGN
jgi:branched-chain amino acid transport system ATP-binding protein